MLMREAVYLSASLQQLLILSPSIDVTTSICGRFALVISYLSSIRSPGRETELHLRGGCCITAQANNSGALQTTPIQVMKHRR